MRGDLERKRSNIEEYNEEAALNKAAFDDVIGDPFAFKNGEPEPIMGQYMRLQQRGSIQAMNNNFDLGKGTRNPAQPLVQDFLCDVDKIVQKAYELDSDSYKKFLETYIYESEDKHYTARDRMKIEQKLGRLFRKHKLSPVNRYFVTTRQ